MKITLRTPKTQQAYDTALKNGTLRPIAEEDQIHDLTYWRIVNNRFPYDALPITKHHLLIPKRKVASLLDLNTLETLELFRLLDTQLERYGYDNAARNLPGMQSVTDHIHFHLYQYEEKL